MDHKTPIRKSSAAPLKAPRIKDSLPLFQKLIILVVTAAAFGPYVTGSLRTEQLAVYGLAALLLPLMFYRIQPWLSVVLPWLAMVIIAFAGLLPPTAHGGMYTPANMWSSADNLLLPLVVLALVWAVVHADHARRALQVAATVVVLCAALNAILSIIGTMMDLSAYLRPFWSGDEGETVAYRAAQLGRLSGIFNQPAEAGLVYGIAGLLAVWRFRHKPKLMLLLVALISVGGMLCVSKVFILGGLPLILIYLWVSSAAKSRIGVMFSLALLALGVAQSGVLQQWSGFNYLGRLIAPAQDQSLIEFYSAGRWNEDAGMSQVFDTIMTERPLTGFGIQGLAVPYDSAWTEIAVLAGIIGLITLAAVFLALWAMSRKIKDRAMRTLGGFIVVFLVGASLGIPSLTANRAATIVWVVLALLCMAAKEGQNDQASLMMTKGMRVDAPVPLPGAAGTGKRALVKYAAYKPSARKSMSPTGD